MTTSRPWKLLMPACPSSLGSPQRLPKLIDWPINQCSGRIAPGQRVETDSPVDERLGIAGSGTIACGLAATAACHGDVVMWVRSEASAQRAAGRLDQAFDKVEEADRARVRVVTDPHELGRAGT